MKKIISLLICVILLCGSALAEQTISLPNSRYTLELPDGMKYSMPEPEDYGMAAYTSEALEVDYVSYKKADAVRQGMAETLRETAVSVLPAHGIPQNKVHLPDNPSRKTVSNRYPVFHQPQPLPSRAGA